MLIVLKIFGFVYQTDYLFIWTVRLLSTDVRPQCKTSIWLIDTHTHTESFYSNENYYIYIFFFVKEQKKQKAKRMKKKKIETYNNTPVTIIEP